MGEKILLIEDDRILSESLKDFLEEYGYRVDVAYRFEEAIEKIDKYNYDVYIIDVNLEDGNGIEIIKYLRLNQDDTPALIISAITDIETIAEGFGAGAEDYIKKPFDPKELLVRLKARLKMDRITYQNVRYEEGRFFVGNEEIELGEVERCILLKFLRNPRKIISKETLFNCMKNPSSVGLRVVINSLRKKTGLNIKAVKGVGYVLD